ncbi:MAG: deoxyuridine 5'-triphosphate nucleotidohydrolase [Desulfurococcaceae archaeon]|nr:deoxyuridine 5'-triphosphate nucleotidohydrolase [Desulfurococcaceae archaeon]
MAAPPQYLLNLGYSTEQLDCAGIKLTLCEVLVPQGTATIDLDSKVLPKYVALEPDEYGFYNLSPGAYVVRYCEYVRVPEDYLALALPRSTLIRSCTTLYTAVWDPGYEGRGYGLLSVFCNGIRIRRGAQVAQLVYVRMLERSAKTYRGTYLGER